MLNIQSYRHLDKEDKVPFSITEAVTAVRNLNYGEQRFLAELVKQREESTDYQKYEQFREHTALLRKLLESGYY